LNFIVLFSPAFYVDDHLPFDTLCVKGSWPVSLSFPGSVRAVGVGLCLCYPQQQQRSWSLPNGFCLPKCWCHLWSQSSYIFLYSQ